MAGSEINVISRTQIVIVEPTSRSVSIINAGPPGSNGSGGGDSLWEYIIDPDLGAPYFQARIIPGTDEYGFMHSVRIESGFWGSFINVAHGIDLEANDPSSWLFTDDWNIQCDDDLNIQVDGSVLFGPSIGGNFSVIVEDNINLTIGNNGTFTLTSPDTNGSMVVDFHPSSADTEGTRVYVRDEFQRASIDQFAYYSTAFGNNFRSAQFNVYAENDTSTSYTGLTAVAFVDNATTGTPNAVSRFYAGGDGVALGWDFRTGPDYTLLAVNGNEQQVVGGTYQGLDIIDIETYDGNRLLEINPRKVLLGEGGDQGVHIAAPPSAPAQQFGGGSEIMFWIDEAANNLKFKVVYSNGITTKTATAALV